MRIPNAKTTTLSRIRGLFPFPAFPALAAVSCLSALAGCNSLDALTPPENVGDGSYQSSPVNQADLDTMSQQQPVVRSTPSGNPEMDTADMPVQRSDPLAGPASVPATSETAFADSDTAYRNPAGSLDAQASALATDPPPQTGARESAVGFPAHANQVSDTAAAARAQQPDEAPASEEAADTPVQAEDAAQQQAAIAPAAKAGPVGTIRFLPIIGAPVEAIRPLSEQLGAEARAHGLTIKTAADPGSQHILKGYFSAFKEGRKTTIVYVWDVLDQAGNRLHRIQGQDTVDTKNADLWSGVPPETMRDIATKSVGQYIEWRDATAG